jgi:putative ABC transport system ATP-binding protein
MNRQAEPPVIQTSTLTKTISAPQGNIPILLGVDLTVQAGEAVSVVGASGSGKSTLLGILAGLDLPSGGKVSLLGSDLGQLDEDGRAALRAGRVGFVFQAFHLLPGLTALDNVALPLELHGVRDSRQRAAELLQRVGLAERAGHYPNQLSGGEQQRVAVARAFAGEPEILFADEPTGNLDAATGARIIDILFELRAEQGTSLVLVTHDHDLAERCDRQYRLANGRLEALA